MGPYMTLYSYCYRTARNYYLKNGKKLFNNKAEYLEFYRDVEQKANGANPYVSLKKNQVKKYLNQFSKNL